MIMSITIKPVKDHFLNDNVDELPTFNKFEVVNDYHINNVKQVMREISNSLNSKVSYHDFTKIHEPFKTMFYNAVYEKIKNGASFDDSEWAITHYSTERHHLNKHIPEDMDLLDVLEYVVDQIVSNAEQLGIKGNVTISNLDLMTALQNTVSKISNMIFIPEEGE